MKQHDRKSKEISTPTAKSTNADSKERNEEEEEMEEETEANSPHFEVLCFYTEGVTGLNFNFFEEKEPHQTSSSSSPTTSQLASSSSTKQASQIGLEPLRAASVLGMSVIQRVKKSSDTFFVSKFTT